MNTSPLRILHVDDNVLDRELVRDALEREVQAFILTVATSRKEFEDQLVTGNWDLILSDFNILGFEGLQVIDAVHRDNPSIPVILVTGTGSEEIAVEAMKRGAADYVIKTPKHIRRLPLAILAAMERKRLQDEHSQSEQALRMSEARLNAFTKALPDLAFIVSEDGCFLHLLSAPDNELFQEGERLIGKHIHEVLPHAVAEQIVNAIHRTIESSNTQSIEYRVDSLDMIWFEVRTSPMMLSDESPMVVYIVRNITDRKLAEHKLRRERNLLRTLIDNVPDYIYVTDHDGNFVASNSAHAAAANLKPAQVIGQSASEVFPLEIAERFHGDDQTIMETNEPLINQERLIFETDNIPSWVLVTKVPLQSETGQVVGLVGIARDITDRRQAEDALRASEEHLRAVVSGTPVILFELDTEGKLIFLQGQDLKVFNLPSGHYLGKTIQESFGEFIPDIDEHFRRALLGEETSSIHTIGDVVLDVRYSPLVNKSGVISGIIGVATDITERLKAEKLQIELEKEQEVIALKERFIATASHDFRTPLAIIKMAVYTLKTYADRMSTEQRSAKLSQIDLQIAYMTELLDDVLTLSKANAGKLEFKTQPVSLKQFCEQIVDNFRSISEMTHSINFKFSSLMDSVEIDPNLVQYILANLLSNAIKYSPDNGLIRFEVFDEAGYVVFQITDNGIGIPETDQAKLFQPFHRAANTKGIGGTGLGLSIAKTYAEAHGGSITVKSKEGEGTTFTIRIPFGPLF
ncbi:MAG: PAS domain-containing protein [Anaerolineaceae bacterium]|nr:PAS domain-containing protein [Anaerolineaceae bacterium]